MKLISVVCAPAVGAFAILRPPDVIIIGAQKGGTSFLHFALSTHPDVYIVPKEVHFFDKCGSHCGDLTNFQWNVSAHKALVVKSPSYCVAEAVPQRIHIALPRVKLIMLLRDPVERAWSQYKMNKLDKRGLNNWSSFREAIQKNLRRMNEPFSYKRAQSWYIQRGFYLEQLERYEDYFNIGQIHILFSEDLLANTVATLDDVSQYIGLRPWSSFNLTYPVDRHHNHKEIEETFSADLRASLQHLFAPRNARLCAWLRAHNLSCPTWAPTMNS